MKPTLLFSAAILLSVATFAQASVKNHETVKSSTVAQSDKSSSDVKSSGSASSSSSIQSNTVSTTEKKGYATVEKEENKAIAEKRELAAKKDAQAQQVKNTTSQDLTISGNEQSDVKTNTSENNNKVNENSSFNDDTHMSATDVKNSANGMLKESKVAIGNSATSATKTSIDVVKTIGKTDEKINASSTSVIKSGASMTHSIKPVPASIKMNTGIKTSNRVIFK